MAFTVDVKSPIKIASDARKGTFFMISVFCFGVYRSYVRRRELIIVLKLAVKSIGSLLAAQHM